MVGFGPMKTAGFLSKRADKPWATLWRPATLDLRTDRRVEFVRRKLRAAAYCKGGVDGISLFEHYDRGRTGRIGFAEFRSACRRDGKMAASQLPDQDLASLFATLDVDNTGALELVEFQNFLNATQLGSPDVGYGARAADHYDDDDDYDSLRYEAVDRSIRGAGAGGDHVARRSPGSLAEQPPPLLDPPPTALFHRRMHAAMRSY